MLAFRDLKGRRFPSNRKTFTGAAWLSSARAVRCWVKSHNERNPRCQLIFSGETAPQNGEEGGDDVKSARPLCLGLHTRYNGWYRGLPRSNPELIPQNHPQFRLQAETACMKSELLVNAGQHTALNTFSGLVHTARHVMKADNT